MAVPIQPIYLKIGPNWPNRQCYLAGSSKMAPRILIFSIAMDAHNSFYVKFIATEEPTFLGYIIQVLTMVSNHDPPNLLKNTTLFKSLEQILHL